LAHWIGDDVIK